MALMVSRRSSSSGVAAAGFTSAWTYGDWNAVSFTGLDPYGRSFLFHQQLFIPTGYTPGTPCGIILTMCGSGQRSGSETGDVSNNDADNTSQLGFSTFPSYMASIKATFPYIIVAPQPQAIDVGDAYSRGVITLLQKNTYTPEVYNSGWQAALLMVNADPKRKCLTGFSGGAITGHNLATRYPNVFAYMWNIEGDANLGNWPYNMALTTSQERAAEFTALGSAVGSYVVEHNTDDPTVPVAGPREIASLWGAPFTSPFTTAPTWNSGVSPNRIYTYTNTNVIYREHETGGHDPSNGWTTTQINAMLAAALP